MIQEYQPGKIVYVIVRNPHAQNVAQIQRAAVVQNPENPNELGLFSHENFYPLHEEFAIFRSEEEAERAYYEAFGSPEEREGLYG